MITLTPITMIRPNSGGIYAPSRTLSLRQITEAEFMERFADHPRAISVSFAPDGYNNPQTVTAYADGMDCWYIVK